MTHPDRKSSNQETVSTVREEFTSNLANLLSSFETTFEYLSPEKVDEIIFFIDFKQFVKFFLDRHDEFSFDDQQGTKGAWKILNQYVRDNLHQLYRLIAIADQLRSQPDLDEPFEYANTDLVLDRKLAKLIDSLISQHKTIYSKRDVLEAQLEYFVQRILGSALPIRSKILAAETEFPARNRYRFREIASNPLWEDVLTKEQFAFEPNTAVAFYSTVLVSAVPKSDPESSLFNCYQNYPDLDSFRKNSVEVNVEYYQYAGETSIVEKMQATWDPKIDSPKEMELPKELVKEKTLEAAILTKIQTLIVTLQREYDSCWPYPNKSRKLIKINALKYILDAANEGIELAIIQNDLQTKHNYQQIVKGSSSTRTADLLQEIFESNPPHSLFPGKL